MILPCMAKDIVTLIKESGEKFEGIKAVISTQRIITFQIDLDIAPKDTITFELPSGTVVNYLVIDSERIPKEDGVDAHYQLLVRKVHA
ncbi:hypothetical protein SAMN05660337_3276 [Maridesulfovibrio ferrireducens]|uniref:Uncharacterized protein n=1 Tax=Maridesulfovibrio ferrireducens TaxID=246191 RepID=A0A1G9L569_9BACT|nr:hypothetical protein [Maridesulfovibrio ferrireducens]SDL57014.1 hypothetical protein SAMN05660337_3276 [Maridesulfovibrio ferrireducens]